MQSEVVERVRATTLVPMLAAALEGMLAEVSSRGAPGAPPATAWAIRAHVHSRRRPCQGMWMAVGAAAGLFAVVGGGRFGAQIRKERGLAAFKSGDKRDPAR